MLGSYHPHGDSSVYDAMVNLAQDFKTRYPLIWGQGNFGSIDGDGAAAYRYTEAKMSKISSEMLRDIEKDTIDMKPNFDGTKRAFSSSDCCTKPSFKWHSWYCCRYGDKYTTT